MVCNDMKLLLLLMFRIYINSIVLNS